MQFGPGDKVVYYMISVVVAMLFLPIKYFGIYLAGSLIAACTHLYWEKQQWRKQGIPTAIHLGLPAATGGWLQRIGTAARRVWYCIEYYLLGDVQAIGREGQWSFDFNNFNRCPGNTFGCYYFGRKQLISSDPTVLHQICVEKFFNFENRRPIYGGPPRSRASEKNLMRHMIAQYRGADWLRVRKLMMPALATGRLRLMMPQLNESSQMLCTNAVDLLINEGRKLDLLDLCGRFVLEAAARACFSETIDPYTALFGGEEHPFVTNACKVYGNLHGNRLLNLFTAYCLSVTEDIDLLVGVDLALWKETVYWHDWLEGLYNQRNANVQQPDDFFQLLITGTPRRPAAAAAANPNNRGRLTKMEVLAQSFVLLVTNHGTTTAALMHMLFALAAHPAMQEQLREEVLRVIGDIPIEYDHVRQSEMPYMEMVMKETLRLFSHAPRMDRECNERTLITVPDGAGGTKEVQFEVGDLVGLPFRAVHHDPRFYPQPERFDPERFSPVGVASRPDDTYLPFGLGRRNCAGMRFVEVEVGVVVATLLRKYRLRPGADAPAFSRIVPGAPNPSSKPLCVIAERL